MKRRFSIVLVVAMFQLVSASSSFAAPIHDVARDGDLAEVKRLIAEDRANVNARALDGRTPLHWASAKEGHTETVQALIAAGADVEALDQFGWTPLHFATYHGHTAIVQALLTLGANVEARASDTWTPLHVAAQTGHAAVVEALVASGADVKARDEYGWTPLKLARKYNRATTVAALQPEAVAQTHTQAADAHTAIGNHALAARSHTWAAKALPETEAARVSYTRAAESFTLTGNHADAAACYDLAGNHSEAARSYISAHDYDSALISFTAIFNGYVTQAGLTSDGRLAAIDEAQAQAIVALETAAVAIEHELEVADMRHDEVAATPFRARALQIQAAIEQVRAAAAASKAAAAE